jgi:hypothetical protein
MEPKAGSKERILEKLSERMGQVSGSKSRRDIGVISYADLGEGQARVLASFHGDVPTFEEVRAWAIDLAKGHIRIYPETLAHYETAPYPVLSFIAEFNKIRKPFKEATASENFVSIGKNTFLDTDLGTTWAKEEVEGNAFLVRIQPDGLTKALESVVTSSTPRMRKIAHEIISATADVKDVVRYFRPDTTIGMGTVMSISEDGVLAIKDNDTHNVYERTFGTVLEIITPGPNTKTRKKALEDYYSTYLGSDLAKQITT